MKKAIILSLLMGLFINLNAQIPAFPGAEGFGKYATGGRNGSVYHVTNLNDSGAGSLRDAVSSGNRIIVFDVGGVIKINSPLTCKSNTYIAGQTAPGEGITIYGDGFSFSGASNVICRYIRVRAGKNASREDAMGLSNGQDLIFDHVSVSWGKDETFSVTSDGKGSYRITIQNSIISQGLLAHSAGGLCEPDGNITIYRTLFADNDTRNFKMKTSSQYVNNIVYNWKSAAYIMGGNSAGTFQADAIGNYFITGPSGGKRAFSSGNQRYNIYTQDNIADTDRDGTLNGTAIPASDYEGNPTFASQAYYPALPTVPAADLLESLLPDVGASLPYRDDADFYVLDDVRSLGAKGFYISSESELPIGIPTDWNLWGGNKRTDSDNDGMPDDWETANGLNSNSASDAMQKADNGYANIENYINSITAENSQDFLKIPINFHTQTVTQNEITIGWIDVTDKEDGYIIEENINGNFVKIARVGKDVSTYTASNLEPESNHIYRVRAYNSITTTNPTNELTVKTRPVPVSVINPDTYTPDVTWTGAESNIWNNVAANWNAGTFTNKQDVLFDDSSSAGTVSIADGIEAGTVFVKGSKDYTFSGVLSGDKSINKIGAGKLTLPADNTYKGSTVIWDGVMEISKLANGGQASSIGASPNYDFNWVWNGGTIRYTGGNVTTDRNAALENATAFEVANSGATVTFNGVVSGFGDFIKTGAGKVYSKFGQHTYTGNTIVREGTYELNGNYAEVGLKGKLILEGGTFKTSGGADGKDGVFSFPIEVRGDKKSTLEPTRNSQIKSNVSGTGDLQINISYLREFYTGNWDEYYGELTVNTIGGSYSDREFMLSSSIPYARIELINNTLKAGKNNSTIRLGALWSSATNAYLVCSYVKTAGGAATWIVGGLNTDEEFRGVINSAVTHGSRKGRSNIVKEGTGYWRLTNTNKYLGTTTVDGGTLIVNGTHTGDKDVSTNVEPGAYTVNAEGTLAGKGRIEAPVTVKSGGFLAPGDFGIGTLSITKATSLESGSTLDIDINRTAKTNDRLSVTGALTLAGDLNINLIDGNFVSGDEMTILSATSYSGRFANIIPATPGDGLYWDTGSLYTSGKLRVTNVATGIKSIYNPELRIRTVNRAILVEGLQSTELITVYNSSGTAVFNRRINSSSAEIPVETGLYILKIGGETMKVIVK